MHRGARDTWDESADLTTLSTTPVTVVCAGVKSILDVAATLERLETLNVPVLGYRTDRFPGFYLADSGLRARLAGRRRPPRSPRCMHARAALRVRRRPARGQPGRRRTDELDRALHDSVLDRRARGRRRRRRARQGRHAVPARALPHGHRRAAASRSTSRSCAATRCSPPRSPSAQRHEPRAAPRPRFVVGRPVDDRRRRRAPRPAARGHRHARRRPGARRRRRRQHRGVARRTTGTPRPSSAASATTCSAGPDARSSSGAASTAPSPSTRAVRPARASSW